MGKEILVAVLTALATSSALWLTGWVGRVEVGVPVGAVVAFNAECPISDWREYPLAYGRFIRGIDRGSDGTDPSGKRTLGSVQSDEFKSHNHERPMDVYADGDGKNGVLGGSGYGYRHESPPNTGLTGGAETRPKNVALLYCEKVR